MIDFGRCSCGGISEEEWKVIENKFGNLLK